MSSGGRSGPGRALAGLCLLFAAAPAGAGCIEIIAHRGASGYLPEHTLPAYALGHGQGAEWIEPDVVLTADGVPVALHDVVLDRVTDVAAQPGLAAAVLEALAGYDLPVRLQSFDAAALAALDTGHPRVQLIDED